MIADLPTELQSNEALKGFEDTGSLAKAYVELHGKVSGGSLDLLPEDVRKDESVQFYKTLPNLAKGLIETKKMVGSIKKAPDTADGYKFTTPSDLHKGLQNIPESQKVLAGVFHKAGVSNEAADVIQQNIFTLLSNSLKKSDEGRTAKAKEVEAALKQEWGNNFDANKSRIENILKRSGAENLAVLIGGDPIALKAMSRITSLLSEDSIGKLGESSGSTIDSKTKEGAVARIEEMKKEFAVQGAKHPLWNEKDAKHQDVKKEWETLHQTAFA